MRKSLHVNPARPPETVRPRRPMSRLERRVTLWLKVLALIAVAIYLVVGVLQFLGAVRATAFLFVGALFFAYLVFPLVRRLNERLPLVWSILLVYAILAIAGLAIAQILVPALVNDVQNAIKNFPAIVTKVSAIIQDPNNRFIRWLPIDERLYLATIPQQIGAYVQTNALDTAQKTLAVVLSTVSIVATVIVIPVLAAYMMLDAAEINEGVLGMLKPKYRAVTEDIIADLDKVVGGFIRGQLIDGSILGFMLTVMLFATGVPYALLIGVVSGALNFIPYAGAIIAFVPAVVLALIYHGPTNAAIVAALIFVIHQIDGNFVAPRVLKDNVGLSPFWIVLAILTGSELFGLAGTFIAVPLAAMIKVLIARLVPRQPVSQAEAAPALTDAPLTRTRPPRRRT